ncbi:MAG TPA: hypothetical protein VFO67_07295 [Gemmatimonadales bacterium]|nr:hypothetical protein [Gemmatimonadales bacterium]
MSPAVFLIALLSTLGIAAFTVITVARVIANRRSLPSEVTERLEELEGAVQSLQHELGEAQQRIDFAERMLSTAREDRRLGS